MSKYENIIPSYDTNRQVLGEIYPLDTPFTAIIDASEVCQFRCNYCFRSDADRSQWGYAARNNLMDWETFRLAAEQLKEFPHDLKQISVSNHGEPLCNRRLPLMVKYIKEQGIKGRVSIHTNAALLDEQYAVELAQSGIDRIVVSLQGMTAEKYRQVCGVGIDYDKFYRNLQILYEAKTNTQICIKVADTALDEGEEDLFYEKFSPIADRVYVEKIIPIWLNVKVNDPSHKIINKYGDAFPIQECCPLIFNTIVVTPDGDVYPCTQIQAPYRLGNIREHSLKELWDSPQRRQLLINQCKGTNHPVCGRCYISQNSVYAKEDMIDGYRDEILARLEQGEREDLNVADCNNE